MGLRADRARIRVHPCRPIPRRRRLSAAESQARPLRPEIGLPGPDRLHQQSIHHRLLQVEVGLPLQRPLHPEAVGRLVRLGAKRLHGRTLARVEGANVDEGVVDGPAHLAAQGVDLPDDVSLGRSAYRGVARHEADAVEVHREKQGAPAHPRRRQRRLYPRVPRPHHNHVILLLLHEQSLTRAATTRNGYVERTVGSRAGACQGPPYGRRIVLWCS